MEFLVTVTSASTSFVDRHIGARRQADVAAMLKAVGYDTVNDLVDTAVPKDIRQDSDLALGAALSEVETTSTAGASSLSYSAGDDIYTYVWKTDKAWAGTCRTFQLKLDDGSTHTASFKFRS